MVFAALSFSGCASGGDRIERFIRLKADYLYMGEPFTAEYIYNCTVRVSGILGGGASIHEENSVGYAYWKLPDGSVMGTELPLVCANSTFKNVPPDFIPRLNWIEDTATGIGYSYTTAVAYDSPLSRFEFLGAEVTRTTREELNAWKKRNKIEIVNHVSRRGAVLIGDFSDLQFNTVSGPAREVLFTNAGAKHLEIVVPFNDGGYGYRRYPMPEGMLDMALEFWPEDAGRYWAIDFTLYSGDPEFEEFKPKFFEFWDGGVYPDVARPQHYYIGGSDRETIGPDGEGIRPSVSGRQPGAREKYVLPEYFPLFPYSTSMPDTEKPSEFYFRSLTTEPEWNGFGAIQRGSIDYKYLGLDIGIDQMLGPLHFELTFDPDGKQKQHFIYIDGEAVYPSLLYKQPHGPNKYVVITPDFILDRTGFIFD